MKRDVSRLFTEALAEPSAGRLRLGAIIGATVLVLAVTAGTAVLPALVSPGAHPSASVPAEVRASPSNPPAAISSPEAPIAAVGGGSAAGGGPAASGGTSAPPTPGDGPPVAGAAVQLSTAARPPATALPSPAPSGTAAVAARFTFEDGGTDGWGSAGHVTGLSNSGAAAHDGSRSLQVALHSTGGGDLPFVEVSAGRGTAPAPGQTLTAWVFVSSGAVSVQGKLFVQDTGFGWHMSALVNLARGGWTKLSLEVPSGVAVNALGAQFLCTPYNTGTTLFVDSVNWG